MTTPSRHPVAFDFFLEVAVIDQLVSTEMERVLPEGLTMSSFSLLNHLTTRGGSDSPARLALALQVTKGAVTALLKRLEARRLIHMSANPRDGRAKIVTLTEEGRRRRDDAIAALDPLLEAFLVDFSETDLANALPLLRRVRLHLNRRRRGL
ncbi:MarR family transcriptional regulator [Phenylobacterium sp.]|jgi:DNA-binding MarR family transcriptional regulator|uniref:MarR family winged helix-turn-helix transcriptional regulator n=1 Tax=Phenylobacterium sp. TaxID=1871053 RepID=UPI0025F6029A|nr:MarR family transcriptional regulator [Phenylobacterium sp.]MCA3722246.1 MarR family transcriptional regulator [Phenylobacterium sp.]